MTTLFPPARSGKTTPYPGFKTKQFTEKTMQLGHIDILGGGPSGLYTAILIRRAMPQTRVVVHEQNARDATFGFGVVFSDKALGFLHDDDPETHNLITPEMERWQDMTLVHKGERVVLDGIGFAAIGRLALLQILQNRALDEGVELMFNSPITSVNELSAELIIGADGFNSVVRESAPSAFKKTVSAFSNHFAWFGASRPFDTLTQTFIGMADGAAMNAHHYRYSPDLSTFIVECDDNTFRSQGFDRMDEESTRVRCEQVFADALQGAALIANKSVWRQFPKLWCDRWYHGNRVLLGDAAHTAHFSIGSGTRLALEDAIALTGALTQNDTLSEALHQFESSRKPIALKIVNGANASATWYDGFAGKLHMPPLDFAFDYITRSGRVDLDRLRKHSPGFMSAYEAHLNTGQNHVDAKTTGQQND